MLGLKGHFYATDSFTFHLLTEDKQVGVGTIGTRPLHNWPLVYGGALTGDNR